MGNLIRPLTAVMCVFALVACGGGQTSPGFTSSPGVVVAPVPGDDPAAPRSRYSFANQCFVMRSMATGNLVERDGVNYRDGGTDFAAAEAFVLKPTALGKYMLFNQARQLLADNGDIDSVNLDAASPAVEFEVIGVGDTTIYPPAPEFNVEPTAAEIATYRDFTDPNIAATQFTLTNLATGNNLAIADDGSLSGAAVAAAQPQNFRLEPVTGCADFPEAASNTVGETFEGTTKDGRVLGMVDAHVHISSTFFLGQAQWGATYHKYGVTHALDDCDEYHGANGERDVVGAAFSADPMNPPMGHDTSGWPTHPVWPARDELLHEAIYWKWIERAWKSGLRVIVNDLVDNETLCELQRNVRASNGDPEASQLDCNSMNNAGRQAGSMYAMQDYIDAQYGGRGEGFYQIVHGSDEARGIIEDGKAAVVLGIEISNLFNCKVNYAPARQDEPFEEDGEGPNGVENVYNDGMGNLCTEDSVLAEMQRIWDWGVRQVITIHEFDNAFGGNGIFDALILNTGNQENSGAIPGGTLANPAAVVNAVPTEFTGGGAPATGQELPSGEFWTTYDCPVTGEDGFEGYLYGGEGGTRLESIAGTCAYMGQGGRPGGQTNCYPSEDADTSAPTVMVPTTPEEGQAQFNETMQRVPNTRRQCNARWLTPRGLFVYSKLMEFGFIFDIDHLELEMKTQGLELAEAQDPPYPFVSTHGTFGGTTLDQARRMHANGGFIYPSLGNGPQFLNDMRRVREAVVTDQSTEFFGFGFGTDTNGLSAQSGPRSSGQIQDAGAVEYPYSLFGSGLFAQLDDFNGGNTPDDQPIESVIFQQPEERDADGNGRTWHLDMDGSAHYGMMSGMVQEVNLHGTAQDMQDLFNSAERFLRTWTATEASNAGILSKTANDSDGDGQGNVVVPANVLRAAPVPPEAGRGLQQAPGG